MKVKTPLGLFEETETWDRDENGELMGAAVWVYRPDQADPWGFYKLAIPTGTPGFKPTGSFFGKTPEVRPAAEE
ncbi:MAG: hypothetical protein KDK05_32195 [Candidatus Competibacteraceae bacterium]|nr:hypothetical protein [Candidatus Competibacteraceae bacterium]